MARTDLQAAPHRRQLPRLCNPGLPRRRPASGHAAGSGRAGQRRAQCRHPRPDGRDLQPHRQQLDLRGRRQRAAVPALAALSAGIARRTGAGGLDNTIAGNDDGVWPSELQEEDYYTRAGEGNLGAGSLDDPHAEFRRTDFVGLRDLNYDGTTALDDIARCFNYWIALTDCDGFRIDTLKHVDAETGRNSCGTISSSPPTWRRFSSLARLASTTMPFGYREVLGTISTPLLTSARHEPLHAAAKGWRRRSLFHLRKTQ